MTRQVKSNHPWMTGSATASAVSPWRRDARTSRKTSSTQICSSCSSGRRKALILLQMKGPTAIDDNDPGGRICFRPLRPVYWARTARSLYPILVFCTSYRICNIFAFLSILVAMFNLCLSIFVPRIVFVVLYFNAFGEALLFTHQ
jgi:hypothetical protein